MLIDMNIYKNKVLVRQGRSYVFLFDTAVFSLGWILFDKHLQLLFDTLLEQSHIVRHVNNELFFSLPSRRSRPPSNAFDSIRTGRDIGGIGAEDCAVVVTIRRPVDTVVSTRNSRT